MKLVKEKVNPIMETCTEIQALRKAYLSKEIGSYTNWDELNNIYNTVDYFSGSFEGIWRKWQDIRYHPCFQVSCD